MPAVGGTAYRYRIAGVLVGALLLSPVIYSDLYDDAYIHARIAENWVSYGAPVFNEGAVFKASSSTGFVLLIALLRPLFGTIGAIRAIESLAIFATVYGLFHWISLSAQRRAAKLWVAVAALPAVLLAAYGGMETPIVCALLVAAALLHGRGRDGAVVFLIALCTWFRFEAIWLLLVMAFYYAHSRKSTRILLYAAPFAMLIATELYLLGEIVPQAARIKSVAYGFPLRNSLRNVLSFDLMPYGYLIGALLLVLFAGHAVTVARNRWRLELPDVLLMFSAAVMGAWIVGRTVVFPWYYCLLTFPFAVATMVLVDEASSRTPRLLVRLHYVAVAVFCVLGATKAWATFGVTGEDHVNLRVYRYRDIGTALFAHCPTCTVVSSEVGGLGYAFKGRVYDAFGLGDPDAARFHPLKVPEERRGYWVGAIPPEYVRYRDPDYVVSMPLFSEALRRSAVLGAYQAYDCALDPSGSLKLFGDTKIQVFSKSPIANAVLDRMRCSTHQ